MVPSFGDGLLMVFVLVDKRGRFEVISNCLGSQIPVVNDVHTENEDWSQFLLYGTV